MGGKLLETLMGAIVLVVGGAFLVFVYTSTDVGAVVGYELVAKFDRVDGLTVGSDVRLAGIKVGTVVDHALEPETYLAVVRMSIDPALQMPTDSSAEIISSGLLGNKYMALVPGGEEEMLKDGGLIRFTQSPVSFEALIGQLIYSQAQSGDKE